LYWKSVQNIYPRDVEAVPHYHDDYVRPSKKWSKEASGSQVDRSWFRDKFNRWYFAHVQRHV